MKQGAVRGSLDDRVEPRDEVYYRTRATMADRVACPVLVVNISASGLMMRSDADVAVGDRIHVMLPTAGDVSAIVRWALGGRIGCQFDSPIPAARYPSLLVGLSR